MVNINSHHIYLDPYLNYLHSHPSQLLDGYPNQVIIENIQTAYQNLSQTLLELTINHPPRLLIAEPEPLKFISIFLAASAANCDIFLCNPDWGKNEWEQALDISQPQLIIGKYPASILNAISFYAYNPVAFTSVNKPFPRIMIPTGGSSGKIKFSIHTWESLSAAVLGFLEHFQLQTVNSICTLPLYHVSGLMQLMRTLLSGGKLAIYNFKQLVQQLEADNFPAINPEDFFISLVPTQLYQLLQNPQIILWLAQMQTVLLGGGPPGNDLLNYARSHRIPVALTYGMTETAAQVATLLPQQFFQGANHCGRVLPHAKIEIVDSNGLKLPHNSIGKVQIQAESLTLGYYNSLASSKYWQNHQFQPDDLGFFDEENNLHILGRSSDKIITGGENVFPDEVETAIRGTGLVCDIKVIGIPDRKWGEVITAIYVPTTQISNHSPDLFALEIKSRLKSQLSKFKVPKYWIPVGEIPRNSQGKCHRQQLEKLAIAYLNQVG